MCWIRGSDTVLSTNVRGLDWNQLVVSKKRDKLEFLLPTIPEKKKQVNNTYSSCLLNALTTKAYRITGTSSKNIPKALRTVVLGQWSQISLAASWRIIADISHLETNMSDVLTFEDTYPHYLVYLLAILLHEDLENTKTEAAHFTLCLLQNNTGTR